MSQALSKIAFKGHEDFHIILALRRVVCGNRLEQELSAHRVEQCLGLTCRTCELGAKSCSKLVRGDIFSHVCQRHVFPLNTVTPNAFLVCAKIET